MSKSYIEKLKDPRWQKKRLLIFQRDNWKCVECKNETLPLHIHHEKYSSCNPWETPDEFLKTLCEECHSLKSSKINQIELFLEKIGVTFSICPAWVDESDDKKYIISVSDL